jgi:hypothetical protein
VKSYRRFSSTFAGFGQVLQLAKYFKVNEDELIVAWLSDKLANEVQDEDLAKQALKAAEKKVEYLKKKK